MRAGRAQFLPGRVILIEPQEAHDGQAGTADGFAASLCDDPLLAHAIHAACGALFRPGERLAREAALDCVLDHLRPHLGQPSLAEPADAPDLVGLALRGPKRDVDKATKGASLHP